MKVSRREHHNHVTIYKKHERNPKPDNAVEKSREIKLRLCKISHNKSY